jgi:hypothetical protein
MKYEIKLLSIKNGEEMLVYHTDIVPNIGDIIMLSEVEPYDVEKRIFAPNSNRIAILVNQTTLPQSER